MYILASTSPRRKEILEKAKIDFKIVASNYVEADLGIDNPYLLAEELAFGKALEVAKSYPNQIVIGADTIVVVEGEVIGKPKDFDDAFNILKKLSNHYQEVVTGVALIYNDKHWKFHAISEVIFRELNDQEIIDYINTGEPYDKAGAYAIQGKANDFVESFKGEIENIVGFPIKRFLKEIRKFEQEINV
ncbi:MAG: Maf family protein [Acholeplasmataceae bacterium]|jgi:septum formation protein